MKTILILSGLLFCVNYLHAQAPTSSQVGRIVYYEGKVELGVGAQWTAAKIESPVLSNQSIRVPGDGMAEILWNNGVKSIVGPGSMSSVESLLSGSTSNAKAQTKGSFDNFKSIFNSDVAQKRTQEGGIRRDEQKNKQKPAKDEIYWKEEPELFFEEVFSSYEAGNYTQAIAQLHAFINQKPEDENIKYAYFALGHSYIMTNNPLKAKELFDLFVLKFGDDALVTEAEAIRSKL